MIGALGMRSARRAAMQFTFRGRGWLAVALCAVLCGQGDRTVAVAGGAPGAPHSQRLVQASWYGEEHRGKRMANGRPFDPDALTCASWFHPFGTLLRVAHGDKVVVVQVTDRGPARRLVAAGREIDLSHAAFRRLADPRVGLVWVTIERLP